jgi:hypothetical protein
VTSDYESGEDFGCECCWPHSADAAWEARLALTEMAVLIDDTHFRVRILACSRCTQQFLSVFEEEVDWEDGEDPQYWTLLPLTRVEAADLVQQGDSLTARQLDALGPRRRCLQFAHPKAEAARIFWGTGASKW